MPPNRKKSKKKGNVKWTSGSTNAEVRETRSSARTKAVYNDNAIQSSALYASTLGQSPPERTRILIAEKAAELAYLQLLYNEDETPSNQLEEKIQTAEDELFVLRAAIAPINRMPAELLSLIFMMHVWENGESPWLLVRVSRAWKVITFVTRNLWARICLSTPHWAESVVLRHTYTGREVCFQPEQFNRALERARGALLDLEITNGHIIWDIGLIIGDTA